MKPLEGKRPSLAEATHSSQSPISNVVRLRGSFLTYDHILSGSCATQGHHLTLPSELNLADRSCLEAFKPVITFTDSHWSNVR